MMWCMLQRMGPSGEALTVEPTGPLLKAAPLRAHSRISLTWQFLLREWFMQRLAVTELKKEFTAPLTEPPGLQLLRQVFQLRMEGSRSVSPLRMRTRFIS